MLLNIWMDPFENDDRLALVEFVLYLLIFVDLLVYQMSSKCISHIQEGVLWIQ